jgi:hypothetical protein
MVLRINDPWRCISDDPLPFNHYHPSTCLNGDCVQGVVILASHDCDFLVKVTALTGQFSSYGIGRVKSHTYRFPLPPGTNIITWCGDSGFRYHPFPKYADLSFPSRSVISFPNTLDSFRKTYELDPCHPYSYHPLDDGPGGSLPRSEQPVIVRVTDMHNKRSWYWFKPPQFVTLIANKGTPPSLLMLAKLAMGWDGMAHKDFNKSLCFPTPLIAQRYYALTHCSISSPVSSPTPPFHFFPFPSSDEEDEDNAGD